jgi:hypothetical protein
MLGRKSVVHRQIGRIAGQVGRAVAKWRKVAARLGLTAAEIDRIRSAFEAAQ